MIEFPRPRPPHGWIAKYDTGTEFTSFRELIADRDARAAQRRIIGVDCRHSVVHRGVGGTCRQCAVEALERLTREAQLDVPMCVMNDEIGPPDGCDFGYCLERKQPMCGGHCSVPRAEVEKTSKGRRWLKWSKWGGN